MVKVRTRPETGNLYFDFGYRGKRCREQTALSNTPANRRHADALARSIERDLRNGRFDYAHYFPDSLRVREPTVVTAGIASGVSPAAANARRLLPTFRDFAETWFAESKPRWRKRYQESVRDVMDRHFLPTFGDKTIDQITRGDLLGFRAEFAKRRGHGGMQVSARRINKVVGILRAIVTEACDRHDLVSPGRGIKPLKQKRSEIKPFTLDEVERLVANVRADFRAYLVTRFYTGLRTGEVNGLQWQDIDFEKNTISVERTVSRDGDGDVKTDLSRRTIPMVAIVRDALVAHRADAIPDCPWVFHSRHGNPIDSVNFANRVWYPLLRFLGLAKRTPYQTRHTAATLMLAAGENPEWIAHMLGHSTTEMLFRTYSRFVPNLTRHDGLAYAGLIDGRKRVAAPKTPSVEDVDAMDIAALRRELKAALQARAGPPAGAAPP
ncbi:MAG TPA: DUF3596 domain-containing protein [Rhodanobacteraceae bacterium]